MCALSNGRLMLNFPPMGAHVFRQNFAKVFGYVCVTRMNTGSQLVRNQVRFLGPAPLHTAADRARPNRIKGLQTGVGLQRAGDIRFSLRFSYSSQYPALLFHGEGYRLPGTFVLMSQWQLRSVRNFVV